jgi:hypothetical protein
VRDLRRPIITTPFSYRCGTFRNRGPVACTNHFAASRRRLEHTVIETLRDRLYTDRNLGDLVNRVREDLCARVRSRAKERGVADRARELRRLDREIQHIKDAVRLGKATSTLLTMLEDAERQRAAVLETAQDVPDVGVAERLGRVLDRLPELVREHLADLETLLAAQQVDKGKAILAALDTTITLHPCGDHLEVEITGRPERLLILGGSKGPGGSTERLFGGWGSPLSPSFEPLSVRVPLAAVR